MTTQTFNYPLSLPATEDPYPTYKQMRDNDPAHYSDTEDIWVLTRFDDCFAAFSNWETWSSERRGNLLNDLPQRIGRTLGTTDPPRHTFARGLVNRAFTPRTVAQLLPPIQQQAKALSDAARQKGAIEFSADFSAPFNAGILGAMFGLPDSEFLRLRHWLDDFFLRDAAPDDGGDPPQVVAMGELRSYLDELADERAANPGDDLMSAMIGAEQDGQRLTRDQVVVTTMTFLTAGFESVNNLFTNLVHALDKHPHVLAALKNDPQLVPTFVEEGMRWDAPAQGFVRTPTRDVQLHDKTIPEGAQVLLHIGAANRDDRQFDIPDQFSLERGNPRHLALGQGVHFCVGAPLGRQMTRIAFEELLAVSDRWDVDLSAAKRVTTPNFRGFSRLPLTIA